MNCHDGQPTTPAGARLLVRARRALSRVGHSRLAVRFQILFTALIALTVLGVGGWMTMQATGWQRSVGVQRGLELATMFASGSARAIYETDDAALDGIVARLARHPDVRYARILGADGRVIAEHAVPGATPPTAPRDASVAGGTPSAVRLPSGNEAAGTPAGTRVVDVQVPVAAFEPRGTPGELATAVAPGTSLPRIVGFVQVGLDDGRSAALLSSIVRRGVLVSLGVGLGGTLLAALLIRRIARPIRRLAGVTRAMSQGDFDQSVDLGGRDEIGQLAASLDVTLARLRDYRAQVEDHQRALEAEVEERTVELQRRANEAVELAARAEASSRTKSEFLANISHELRTPLGGVVGMTELLLETPLDPTQERYATTVRESAELLLALIHDLLDFSRGDAGRLELDRSEFDTRGLIEDVTEIFTDEARSKGLDLICFVDEGLPEVLVGDEVRLRQVLTNLVGNAVKFTATGEVVVRAVPLHPAEDGRITVELSVTDTGIGIAEDARERIFEAFEQADGSMARRFGGTGLGLAISRQLAELMGAELGVESREGRGSHFWLRVPLEIGSSDERPGSDAAPPLAGRRILVVDERETRRRILARQLRKAGADVDELADAEDARQPLAQRGYDGAVCDVDVALTLRASAEPGRGEHPTVWIGLGAPTADTPAGLPVLPRPPRHRDLVAALLGDRERQASRPGADVPPLRAGLRILVAEDNPVNQQVATAMLGGLGCDVTCVETGLDAVARVRDARFDAVFMDCQMPELDGFEATRRIRQAETGDTRLPIIALTAHATGADRAACLAAGMDDYLSKPCSRAALGAALARHVGEAATHPTASCDPTADPTADTSTTCEQATPAAPSGSPAPDAGVLDVGVLSELRDLESRSQPGLLTSLVEAYLESSSALERELVDGLRADDERRIARAAHPLKSSSAQVGALGLAALCKELEAAARAGRMGELRTSVDAVLGELEQVRESLAAALLGASNG